MTWSVRLPLSVLVACVCLLGTVSLGATTTFYTEKTATCAGCSDANTCLQAQTAATGKATINGGILCLAAADTLEVGNGSYNEYLRTATTGCPAGFTCNPIPSGTGAGGRTVIQAKAGHSPVIKPTAQAPSGASAIVYFNKTTASAYIDIGAIGRGFLLDASTCSGYPGTTGICANVVIGESSGLTNNIRILGNTLHYGHWASGAGCLLIFRWAHTNTIGGNTFWRCGRNSANHGIYVTTSDNILEDNLISESGGLNITIYKSPSLPWPHHSNIIRRNTLHTNAIASDQSANLGIGGDTNLVYANVLYGNKNGGLVVKYGTPTGNKIYNNTIYGGTSYGISIGADAVDTDVRNNIVSATGTGIIDASTTTIREKNLGCATCELTANPQLVSPTTNMHLQATSPAINAGANLTATVVFDRDGTPYNVPMEIGAYNAGTTVIPLVLVFTAPPVGAVEGAILPTVRAEIRDTAGVLQPGHAANCVIAKASGPGTLSGTTNVAPSGGVCTWSNLSLNQDGTYTLSVTSTGVTGVTSGSFVITDAAAAPVAARLHRTRP